MHLCLQADVSASGYRLAYLAFPGVPCILLAGFLAFAFVFIGWHLIPVLGNVARASRCFGLACHLCQLCRILGCVQWCCALPTSPLTPPPGFAALVLGLSNSCWMGSAPHPTRAALLRRWYSYDGKELCCKFDTIKRLFSTPVRVKVTGQDEVVL